MTTSYALDPDGIQRFVRLRSKAVETLTERFYATYAAEYARFGERGRKACREDIEFQLDFLRPVLEFGRIEPYVEYQRWFATLLTARRIPAEHIGVSLAWLGEFFLAQLAGPVGETIASALTETARRAALPIEEGPPPRPLTDEQIAFEAALLRGDRRLAQALIATRTRAGEPLVETEIALIQSALHHIGERWLRNEVSVAEEHLATATAHTVMAEALASADVAPGNGRKALFACVEGNQHAIGLRMVADAYELAGWDVQCLGGSTPTRALVAQIAAWRPELVGLSIAFAHQLDAGRETIKLLREQLGERCPRVIIGGGAVNRFGPLARLLGADACGVDALDAMRLSS